MESIELIKAMIEKTPEQGEIWYLLGNEYARQSLKNDAILAFSTALKYCDDNLKMQISEEMAKLALTGGNSDNTYVHEPELDEDELSSDTAGRSEATVLPFTVIEGGQRRYTESTERIEEKITFEDVGGLNEIKRSIRLKIIEPFERPALFNRFRKKTGGGILLYGPPGCGKTYLARATAGECKANFITVRITDVLSKWIGESEENIKNIFGSARSEKPCILFLMR